MPRIVPPPATPDLDRRFLLQAIALLAPSLACGPRGLLASPQPPDLHARPVAQAVVALGRLYLGQRPDEADRDTLRAALGIVDDDEPELARLARINAAIDAEIEADDLVRIAGWQLAPTECRVYALAALSA